MKLGIFSDLHMDYWGAADAVRLMKSLREQAHDLGVDYMLCAGDVYDGAIKIELDFGGIPGSRINGNHDLFGRFLSESSMFERTLPNGMNLKAATLWTDFHDNIMAEIAYQTTLPDTGRIKEISPAKIKYLHGIHRRFIFDTHADVVMTHNPPTMQSVGAAYANAGYLNQAFMSELSDFIQNSDIKLWVCGHVHHKHSYMVGNTKVVCNPLGYPGQNYQNVTDYKLHIEEL